MEKRIRRRLSWSKLILVICLAVLVWETFQQLFINKTGSKIKFKMYSYSPNNFNRQSLSHPIHVHIYNKIIPYFGKNLFANCSNKCYETSGTKNYNSTKYVVFLFPKIGYYPPKKYKNQVWILYGKESPYYNKINHFNFWRNMVNLTMAHRRDSDIHIHYGGFKKYTQKRNILIESHYNKQNPKFVFPLKLSWMVSNCNTPSKREKYVDLLKKEPNVTVDVYVRCGTKKCPKANNSYCLNEIESKYPFYLAFENSFCVDYITEKAFKIYQDNFHMIPVVRGDNKSYEKILPKGSYINVNNFVSIKQLLKKLKGILEDEMLFNSFFDWREHFQPWRPNAFCLLCELLIKMERSGSQRFYEDINLWVHGYKGRNICHKVV